MVLLGAAMLVGTFGTVVPLLPGLPIVWAAALVYALLSEPDAIGWVMFGTITVLAVLGLVAGAVLPHRRVAAAGVPRSSIVAGLICGVVGFFAVPVVGLPLGAALGIFLSEAARLNDGRAAWAATKSLLIGFGLGALVQFGVGVAMMGVWIAWVVLD